ncbi:hypothetical protein BV22DRAFT_1130574 [Leucogyrophana mollusca]|uniref:Uncharacterized protein n=1 Tax=Leucogyrophana mollusca TaxID=85980 RepID=A0ACB8BCX8_9AGAM|nr:hypothetical protein BV22DRAFT_1130574 [Leucogyrophana mollusca]
MLGVDHCWLRLHLAYGFEDHKRTRAAKRLGLSYEERQRANREFVPGEIAHVDGRGGINAALFEFMTNHGFKLTPRERKMKFSLDIDRRHVSKYCLVLERLSATHYVVCYLASFGGAVHSSNLSPVARFFSIAMGDSSEWPPGVRPLHMIPRWTGYGFLFGVPVIRTNLAKTWHGRHTAGFGELDRMKSIIENNMMRFREERSRLLADEFAWLRAVRGSEKLGITSAEITTPVTQMVGREAVVQGSYLPAPASEMAGDELETRKEIEQSKNTGPTWRLPPIRLLEVPKSHNNVRWILSHLRQDIMHSSSYLNRPRTSGRPSQTILRRIPLPFKKLPR